MRALALDLGDRRIGVALSDSAGLLATPYTVVQRTGDRAHDHARIAGLVEETEAEILVVGMPFSLDGTVGPAAAKVEAELAELRDAITIKVVTWDERLSTVEAQHRLREAGVRGKRSRRVVDQVAATVVLQSWLDATPAE